VTAAVTISGVGHHLPETVQDNESLCAGLDVTPEWIVEKTGIEQRHVAGPDDTASDFAIAAAGRALAMAGVAASEVDLIIACTFSGDYVYPPVSAQVQRALRATEAQVFDVQVNCTGFVTGLTLASDRMKADPTVRHAVVVGVELLTRYIDGTDVNTAVYLADGAGAAVLSRSADPDAGIQASAFATDSSNFEAVRMRGGGSSFRSQGRDFDPAVDFMEMNGIATWKQAITHLPKVVRRACEKSGVELASVDFIVLHQANLRLIEYIVRKLGLDLAKTYTNVARVGNTGSASLAIALSEAVQRGLIRNGDTVVLGAVGAGFTFGASVWRWQLPAGGEG
jgi:3-oxoacyl-[acyl-carrier-protein] synthase-3